LVLIHLLWPAEPDSPLLCVRSPGTCPFPNEVALELGDAGEDDHDHLAGMGGGIGPGFGDGLKPGAGLADGFDDRE